VIPLEFDMVVLKEGKTFVAYSPELDVSSCGASVDQARTNLKTAVRLFLEEAEKMGTTTSACWRRPIHLATIPGRGKRYKE